MNRIQLEKKKLSSIFLTILLFCFLFSTHSVFSALGAEVNLNIVLKSQGTIVYPAVIPEIYAQTGNLAPISSTVTYNEYGFPMSGVWGLLWTTSIPQYTFIDNSVTRNGPSLRTESTANAGREVNSAWYTIHPGDHFVFRAWIKTGDSPNYNGNPSYGARIGCDFLGYSLVDGWQRVYCVPLVSYGSWVPWGTNEWTMIEWDFVVPGDYFDTNMNWGDANYGVPGSLSPRQIGGCMAWLATQPNAEAGDVWFSDIEIYINP